ncbi:MAG TPA: YihY/virulence factor BrkB family protein [Dehalococcoidia bacterium]|nr:YihY/virulence factor BrkB family protein [Dehalococcoidia bacterium]
MAVVIDRIPHWRVNGVDVTAIAKETAREVADDDVSTLAAAMTYHVILAIFPFLLFLAGVTSIIDTLFGVPDLTERITDQAAKRLPDDATSVIEGFTEDVVRAQGGAAIGLGLVGALWAASSAMKFAMKAMNRAYDVEDDRPFLRKQVMGVVLTLLFGGLVLGAGALFASGRFLAGGLGEVLGWESAFVMLWNIATPVLAVALILLAVALFYYLAPNADLKFQLVSPGSLLFLVGWLIFTFGFAWYASNFGSYNRVYGSIGAVIILLIWIYWSNMLLLIGAELNAAVARRYDAEYRADPRTEAPPQQPLP